MKFQTAIKPLLIGDDDIVIAFEDRLLVDIWMI